MKKMNVGKLIHKNLYINIDSSILMPVDTYMASLHFKFGQAVCNMIILNESLKQQVSD